MDKPTTRPSVSTPSRVLVADALAATRAGIRAAVAPLDVVAEAEDAPGAVQAAVRERPDVALLSLSLRGAVGAIGSIVEAVPSCRVLALAEDESDEDAISAMAAGATGFVVRAEALEHLPEVLAAALNGHALVSAPLLVRIAERAQRERRDALWRSRPRTTLSPRERQVLEALRKGASTADIALALGLSEVTVRRYVSGVLRKAGVPNREALSHILSGRKRS